MGPDRASRANPHGIGKEKRPWLTIRKPTRDLPHHLHRGFPQGRHSPGHHRRREGLRGSQEGRLSALDRLSAIRWASRKARAQVTQNYDLGELLGRRVAAVVNFEPKQIGKFMSEVLCLGFPDRNGEVVLLNARSPGAVPAGGSTKISAHAAKSPGLCGPGLFLAYQRRVAQRRLITKSPSPPPLRCR